MDMNRQGRILIVDDSEKWCEQLVEILQGAGYFADFAFTVAGAMELLKKNFYHVLVLDIRMNRNDKRDEGGIELLGELDKRGLKEATKVIILSAFGNQERMRMAFRDFRVADFHPKDKFNKSVFLECVQRVFVQEVNINLALKILWQQIRPEQLVVNLEANAILNGPDTDSQKQMTAELEDLLCRLFYGAKSVLVRPLTQGHSGMGVLRVQPSYTMEGSGHEVVAKFGDFHMIEKEYSNFKKYVQPFLGGGRNTTVLDFRRTHYFGGIIYSLLGTVNDQLMNFGDFYSHSEVPKIKEAMDRLFQSCSVWYANRGLLEPLDLTTDYQRLLDCSLEALEQAVTEQLKSVKFVSSTKARQGLHFNHLKSNHTFTNPFSAISRQQLVRTTYLCITHGDFNHRNLLVDSTGHMWMIDFQGTGQSHILRDVAMLDSVIRFQLLAANEATLQERFQMEDALCSIDRFSHVEQLKNKMQIQNRDLVKAFDSVVHLRSWAHKLVDQNPNDDISEYYIALLYNALNTLQFSSLSPGQREHALLSASLLADRLGLNV